MIPAADFARSALGSVTWASVAGGLLQATLIATLGSLALMSLKRASAASRHLVALATLASLLALPIAAWAPKPWSTWSISSSLVPDAPRSPVRLSDPAPYVEDRSTPAVSKPEAGPEPMGIEPGERPPRRMKPRPP